MSIVNHPLVRYWSPAILSGAIVWIAFLAFGDTPLSRASGLALAIVGVALSLRRMGSFLAITGSLTLAFSPAFWAQTGGGQNLPATIVIAIGIALTIGLIIVIVIKRPYIALSMGLLVFAIIFWSQIGTSRSLRLTGLLSAWLLFILVESLLMSNPRPDGPPPIPIKPQQYWGMLIILIIGIINDPLFVLLMPAIAIGLWLSNASLHWIFWLVMFIALLIGLNGILITYIDPEWWNASAWDTHHAQIQTPHLIAESWHEGIRWANVIKLIIQQVTIFGAILSVLGLARMTRWYPILGIVLMIAYACFVVFALLYYGDNREILLIPLFTIQIIWLTYAIFTLGQWLTKSSKPYLNNMKFLVNGIYLLLPLYLLTQIP